MSDRTELKFPVTGMTCAACVRRVESAIQNVSGVTEASVNLATSSARVAWDASAADSSAIVAAVRDAGYGVETERLEGEVEGIFCASCVANRYLPTRKRRTSTSAASRSGQRQPEHAATDIILRPGLEHDPVARH